MLHCTFSFCRITKGLLVGFSDTRAEGDMSYRDADSRVFGNRIGIALAWLLLVILASTLPVWWPSDAKRDRINSIVRCKSKSVQQIVLSPVGSDVPLPLVSEPVVINDRGTIEAICQALNSASIFYPNHPSIKWEVKVELRTRETTVSFVVWHTDQDDNGTVVSIASHGTSGWNYGSYRCDSLEPIFEELVTMKEEAGINGDE